MSAVVLYTNTIIGYFLNSEKLSDVAREAIKIASQIYIASISLVEMIYLNEKGKIADEPYNAIDCSSATECSVRNA